MPPMNHRRRSNSKRISKNNRRAEYYYKIRYFKIQIMYYPYFIAYILIGLIASIMVFWWALSSGQFRDQQRARYLPLHGDEDTAPMPASKLSRLEFYGLFLLALVGIVTSAGVLVLALYTRH
jgi:cbb3-type cytochrome oxidase maturation protein